jgi:hypothetical protein
MDYYTSITKEMKFITVVTFFSPKELLLSATNINQTEMISLDSLSDDNFIFVEEVEGESIAETPLTFVKILTSKGIRYISTKDSGWKILAARAKKES